MTFRHEALLYAGDAEFVAQVEPCLREGLAGGEAVMVAVSDRKIRRLRDRLGRAAGDVAFADMDEIGTNPGRIIHAWHEFAAPHLAAGRPVRGVGEPVSAARSADELVECHRHEELLNVAFEAGPGWLLVCPYDTTALDSAVIAGCRSSHPHVRQNGVARSSDEYTCEIRDSGFISEPLAGRLRPPITSRGGNGMWLANQLCDLVQVRSSRAGTTVRVLVRRG